MKPSVLTKAFKSGSQTIAIFQYGEQFKIMKKVINYVRGKNVESWRVMGAASTFDNLSDCVAKFERLVNNHRKSVGKQHINMRAE